MIRVLPIVLLIVLVEGFYNPTCETCCNCLTSYYYPVCASNGKKYNNICEFNCARQFNLFSNGNLISMTQIPCYYEASSYDKYATDYSTYLNTYDNWYQRYYNYIYPVYAYPVVVQQEQQTTTESSDSDDSSSSDSDESSSEDSESDSDESTTESSDSDESTTEPSDESTTEPSDESTTEASDESTTEPSDESTTEASDESTTKASDEATTEKPDDSNESTTKASDEATTEKPDSNESTTKKDDEKTKKPDDDKTEKPEKTTPEQTTPAETTPAETTPAETTPAETTPEATTVSTTPKAKRRLLLKARRLKSSESQASKAASKASNESPEGKDPCPSKDLSKVIKDSYKFLKDLDQKRSEKNSNPTCETCCSCPTTVYPVCASNGKKYDNMCLFKCASTYLALKKREYIAIVKIPCVENETTSGNRKGKRKGPQERQEAGKAERNCKCPNEDKKVCASNGAMYLNKCFFKCAQKYLKETTKENITLEPCGKTRLSFDENRCICPANYSPVCGSNGKEYSNSCAFDCAKKKSPNLKKVPCRPEKRIAKPKNRCVCSKEYYPVCASNGKIFPNECLFSCYKKAMKKEGVEVTISKMPCFEEAKKNKPSEISRRFFEKSNKTSSSSSRRTSKDVPKCESCCNCTVNVSAVCATDGAYYPNQCMFDCAKKFFQSKGVPFEQAPSCPEKGEAPKTRLQGTCKCPLEDKPVCASNGRTYDNKCFFKCDQKRLKSKGISITLLDKPCQKPGKKRNSLPPPCTCSKTKDEVCDQKGRRYFNPCYLGCQKKTSGEGLVVTKCPKRRAAGPPEKRPPGEGLPGEECQCRDTIKPVCTSNGKRFRNKCIFACAKRKLSLDLQEVPCPKKANQRRGPNPSSKKSCFCPNIYFPICASDGRTYFNECHFRCKKKDLAKQSKTITIVRVPCFQKDSKQLQSSVVDEWLKECDCPKNYLPICASNGKRYPNDCVFECYKAYLKKKMGAVIVRVKYPCFKEGEGSTYIPPLLGYPQDEPPGGEAEGTPYGEEGKPFGGKKPYGAGKPYGEKPHGDTPYGKKPYGEKPYGDKPYGTGKPYGGKKPYGEGEEPYGGGEEPFDAAEEPYRGGKPYGKGKPFGGGVKPSGPGGFPVLEKGNKKSLKADCANLECSSNFPVCASNGEKYPNECIFECFQKKLKNEGVSIRAIKVPCYEKPVLTTTSSPMKQRFQFDKVLKTTTYFSSQKVTTTTSKACKNCCQCPLKYYPVCASNGKTYPNECTFRCARNYLKKKGVEIKMIRIPCYPHTTPMKPPNSPEAPSKMSSSKKQLSGANAGFADDCDCPPTLYPVCASNGQRYPNECFFECSKKKLKLPKEVRIIKIPCEEGPTMKTAKVKNCHCLEGAVATSSPICASNGKKYRNKCEFNCDRKVLGLHGVHLKEVPCTGKRQEPPISLERVPREESAEEGPPAKEEPKAEDLPKAEEEPKVEEEPKAEEKPKAEEEGPKALLLQCKKGCPKIYNPVCASDRIRYPNPCIFSCVQTYLKTNGTKIVVLKAPCFPVTHGGSHEAPHDDSREGSVPNGDKPQCEECCPCPRIYSPVCASNGKKYNNRCIFECAKRFLGELNEAPCHGSRIKKDPVPTCEECCKCKKGNPICASNGKKYENDCYFECAKNFFLHSKNKVIARGEMLCLAPKKKDEAHGAQGEVHEKHGEAQHRINFPVEGVSTEATKRPAEAIKLKKKKKRGKGKRKDRKRSKDNPCKCSDMFFPVCASNGERYHNYCQFKCEKKRLEGAGGLKISVEEFPCFTSGSTTSSPKRIKTSKRRKGKNLTVKTTPDCEDCCPCPKNYMPLCASNGKKYHNKCTFECAKKFFEAKGETITISKYPCDPYLEGSDEVTQTSAPPRNEVGPPKNEVAPPKNEVAPPKNEVAPPKNVTKEPTTEKEAPEKEISMGPQRRIHQEEPTTPGKEEGCQKCPETIKPVCASNGMNYRNPCIFECSKKVMGVKGTHLKEVDCFGKETHVDLEDSDYSNFETDKPETDPECEGCCSCPSKLDEVCASNGKTYLNKCLFNCAQKYLSKKGTTISIQKCLSKKPLSKSRKIDFDSKDATALKTLIRAIVKNSSREKKKSVPSCEDCCTCKKNSSPESPVCASNGKKYSNWCLFDCARKFFKSKGESIYAKNSCPKKDLVKTRRVNSEQEDGDGDDRDDRGGSEEDLRI